MTTKKEYNTTQLEPESAFKRHVFHRDYFAHFLRWNFVLKIAKPGMNILDFGCGSGNMAEVFYRNRYTPNQYLGLDIRPQTIKKANEKFEKQYFINFEAVDLVKAAPAVGTNWDIITSFEVIEHVGKANAPRFLENIKKCMNKDTIFLLSTPVYDEKVGAADNHIIDGVIGEFGYLELNTLLNEYFIIEEVFGTFASQKDYKNDLEDWQQKTFDELHKYYDSNLVSVIMAPLIRAHKARNCIWRLRLK